MNKYQTNKLASYTATERLLKATPEIDDVPGLPAKVARLSAKVGEINSLAKTQTQPIQVRTTERDLMLGAMTEMTLEIAGFVRTVARELQRPPLAQAVQVGVGSFRRARLSHRVWFAQRVLDAAQTVLPQLGTYGVTAETVATLQGLIQSATENVNLPRETVGVKKAATQQLVSLFADVDALLEEEIDPLVFPLRKTLPGFFSAFESARSVFDVPGTRQAEEEPEDGSASAGSNAPTTAFTSTKEKAAA